MASSSTESVSPHESSFSAHYDFTEGPYEPMDFMTPLERAREVISRIDTGNFIEYLILNRNGLGDDGLRELFSFLCKDNGRRCRVNSIILDWTEMDDGCLEAFAEWLTVDKHLETLDLRSDKIHWQGDEPVVLKLLSAINSSQVTVLTLTTRNWQLCDPLLISLASQLDAPVLRRLNFDGFGLTSESTSALISYLTSPRSRMLEYIGCEQSRFSRPEFAFTFLTALLESNFTLSVLLMDTERYIETHPDDPDVHESMAAKGEELLNRLHLRNKAFSQKAQEEARLLLLCSRILLHHPALRPRPGGSAQLDSQTASVSPVSPTAPSFPFHALPVELRQHVLVFLTPALSHAQRLRVFASAASFPELDTEPWLMTSAECQCDICTDTDESMDSESMEFCRSHAWELWLGDVGCTHFEPPEGLTEADALRLL